MKKMSILYQMLRLPITFTISVIIVSLVEQVNFFVQNWKVYLICVICAAILNILFYLYKNNNK